MYKYFIRNLHEADPYKVTALVEKPRVEKAQIAKHERVQEFYRNEIVKEFQKRKQKDFDN